MKNRTLFFILLLIQWITLLNGILLSVFLNKLIGVIIGNYLAGISFGVGLSLVIIIFGKNKK